LIERCLELGSSGSVHATIVLLTEEGVGNAGAGNDITMDRQQRDYYKTLNK
jgi:hypothetical protein